MRSNPRNGWSARATGASNQLGKNCSIESLDPLNPFHRYPHCIDKLLQGKLMAGFLKRCSWSYRRYRIDQHLLCAKMRPCVSMKAVTCCR